MARIIKEDGVYLVNSELLSCIADIINEIELININTDDDRYKGRKFNNDRLLYKLGVLSGLFNSKSCFSEIVDSEEK